MAAKVRFDARMTLPKSIFSTELAAADAQCRLEIDLGVDSLLCVSCSPRKLQNGMRRVPQSPMMTLSRQAILELKHAGSSRWPAKRHVAIGWPWQGRDILPDTDWLDTCSASLSTISLTRLQSSRLAWPKALRDKLERSPWLMVFRENGTQPSQGGLSAKQRQRNVAGAFRGSQVSA